MDTSGNGILSKREIKAGVDDPFTKAYFAQLSIDIEMNPEEFFRLLDTDGNDQVDIEEFVQTCMRLQGGAKPLELQRILNNLNLVVREVSIIKANLEGVDGRFR
ncbi:unnamed protein product [Prorocentrum cordatum]|uniref:EF-hand domain-containing protein n=1 Tax=Prorocentrum cordatum TaxID=2364126 RepID=A0ABN9TPB3_9DINO|nr:unnamed protein product [Polarella glacialis]